MCKERIRQNEKMLDDKKIQIELKHKENETLREELDVAQTEIDEVINEKQARLRKIVDSMMQVNVSEFNNFLVANEFDERE